MKPTQRDQNKLYKVMVNVLLVIFWVKPKKLQTNNKSNSHNNKADSNRHTINYIK